MGGMKNECLFQRQMLKFGSVKIQGHKVNDVLYVIPTFRQPTRGSQVL